MKTLAQIVNKKYEKRLLDQKAYKKSFATMSERLKEYGILATAKSDVECFRVEMIYQSLMVKRQLEDVFFDTYVSMYDYWYDLTYLERKQQMNMEITKLLATLPHFKSGTKEIFMPCFDERFNHLYTEEIVLLDLKQYHTFIRTCAQEVQDHLYGYERYAHGFSSCIVCAHTDLKNYVLYHASTRRFYVFRQDVYEDAFSLDPKQKECPEAVCYAIGTALLQKDEETLLELLLEYPLVSTRMQKKLENYRQKRLKQKTTKE